MFMSVVADLAVLFADAFASFWVKFTLYSTHPRKFSDENRGVMPASGPATELSNYETCGGPDAL